MRYVFFFLLGFLHLNLDSQSLPTTNLYCLHINNVAANTWTSSKIEFLNSFNINGYNNQPFFINSHEVLLSVQKSDADQTDIYKLNLDEREYKNIISNPGKDYSPRINAEHSDEITCVHINENDTVQSLVSYSASDGKFKKTILDHLGQIGYYRYISEDRWVCFLVDQPNHLMSICNSKTKERKIFASSIGRTFEAINSNEIYFVHKILDDQWIFKSYDIALQKMKTIAKMPFHSEDFLIDESGRLICSSDSKIMYYDVNKNIWQTLIDLNSLGIRHIGRICLKSNLLLLVDDPK